MLANGLQACRNLSVRLMLANIQTNAPNAPESLTHLGRVTGAVPRPAAGVAAGTSAVAAGEVVAGCIL